jgi:hypothetical protein
MPLDWASTNIRISRARSRDVKRCYDGIIPRPPCGCLRPRNINNGYSSSTVAARANLRAEID